MVILTFVVTLSMQIFADNITAVRNLQVRINAEEIEDPLEGPNDIEINDVEMPPLVVTYFNPIDLMINFIAQDDLLSIQFMLENQNIDINSTSTGGIGLVHTCVGQNRLDILESLLRDYGANPNLLVRYINNDIEYGPVHIAVRENNLTALRLLFRYGANINQLVHAGIFAPIHVAVYLNRADAINIMMNELGGDINLQNRSGDTALHIAASEGNVDIVRVLLSIDNIDVNLTNIQGFLPEDVTDDDQIRTLIRNQRLGLVVNSEVSSDNATVTTATTSQNLPGIPSSAISGAATSFSSAM